MTKRLIFLTSLVFFATVVVCEKAVVARINCLGFQLNSKLIQKIHNDYKFLPESFRKSGIKVDVLAEKGEVHLIKNPKTLWVSMDGFGRQVPQGDPRWFISIFGEDVADFLGFRMIDENHMILPTPERFNQKITELKQFSINGKMESVNGQIHARDFLKLQKDEIKIPIAILPNRDGEIDSTVLLHDYAYHLAQVLLPEESSELLKNQNRYLLNWEHFVLEKYPHVYKQHKEYFEKMIEDRAHWIDLQMGYFTQDMADPFAESSLVGARPRMVTEDMRSPQQLILKYSEKEFKKSEELRSAFQEFEKKYSNTGDYTVAPVMNDKDAVERIQKMRTDLHEAVMKEKAKAMH